MGMIFDHGLDAASAIVMTVVILRMVQVGGGITAVVGI